MGQNFYAKEVYDISQTTARDQVQPQVRYDDRLLLKGLIASSPVPIRAVEEMCIRDSYCTKTHDSLRISNGKWCWFSRGIGGYSALDYLIKVKGCSFMEAMEAVAGRAAAPPPSFTSVPREEKPKHLLLPPPAPNNQAMLDVYKRQEYWNVERLEHGAGYRL